MMRLLVTLALLAGLGGSAAAQAFGPPPPPEVTWEPRPGARLPEVTLRDEEGRPFVLRPRPGGRPVVLVLVYFECPMLCSLVMDGLETCLRALSFDAGRDFDVWVVDIDPGETPELAARARATFLASYGRDEADPAGVRFLTGDEESVRAVADAIGFGYTYVPASDEYAHAAGITVLTPDARVSHYFYGIEFAPRDLRLALVEASAGKIGTTFDQVLLRCFHYDPAQGKYGLAILGAIRLGGLLTVLLLTLFVVRALRRDRRAHTTAPHAAGGR